MLLNNWMKNIGDERLLQDLNIPGTHDSSTKYCRFSLFSGCQKKSIAEQLEIGVRVFDIRVDKMVLCHSFCKCRKSFFGKTLTLDDVIGDMLSFLNKNPSETILMFFKMDNGDDSSLCFQLLYDNFIKTNPDKWYLENKIPTLGEARGKIALLKRADAKVLKSGIDFNAMPYQGGTKEYCWEDFSPNGEDNVIIQDRYMLTRKKKWEKAVKPLLEAGESLKGSMIFNFFSSAGIPLVPRFNAGYVNGKFNKYDVSEGRYYGVLMFDFADEKLSRKVIETNFKVTSET